MLLIGKMSHEPDKRVPSASDITQAKKSWMSRLRNLKLATIRQGRVYVGLWSEGFYHQTTLSLYHGPQSYLDLGSLPRQLSRYPWPLVLPHAALWAYSGTGSRMPPGDTHILRPCNLWHISRVHHTKIWMVTRLFFHVKYTHFVTVNEFLNVTSIPIIFWIVKIEVYRGRGGT